MTDLEFDVLDELYFVQSFADLEKETALDADTLKKVLEKMYHKGWVRCMKGPEGNEQYSGQDFPENYSTIYFLASKEGLLAHNSR